MHTISQIGISFSNDFLKSLLNTNDWTQVFYERIKLKDMLNIVYFE